MTDLDRLIQTLENVHQSLHRVYRFLGQTPPCQSEPGSCAPQASDTAQPIDTLPDRFWFHGLNQEGQAVIEPTRLTELEERAWRIRREQAAGLFEELDRLEVQRQRQAVKDTCRGMGDA